MHSCTSSVTVGDSLLHSFIELIPNIHTEESSCSELQQWLKKDTLDISCCFKSTNLFLIVSESISMNSYGSIDKKPCILFSSHTEYH